SPGTALAKGFTSQAGVRGGAQTLACLPSLPYILAAGQVKAANPGAKASALETIENLLKLEALKKVPDELKARTRKLAADCADEFTGAQVVIGGAPAAGGVLGEAIVVQCRDSEKVRTMMAEATGIAESYIKTLVDDPKIQQLKLTYTRGAETVDGVAVDVLEVSHPEISGMTEEEKAKFKKAMGEEKFVLRVAAVGKGAAVITMGGGQAMLTEAVKAAASKGPISTAPGTAAALKHLPANPSAVVLINVANALDVVRAGMTIMGSTKEEADQVPKFKCVTPIAMGSQAMTDGGHAVIYIPTDLLKEAFPAIMGAMMGGPGGPPGEAPPPSAVPVPVPAPAQ
ncbi:MAG: hypothetical protein NT031_20745, partial [Planctomycetota bacterium]|nr:hypothetical protein [Planctomycetota bacterium]